MIWITSANPVSRWAQRHVLLKRLLWEPVRIVFLVFFRWWGVYILKIFLKRFFFVEGALSSTTTKIPKWRKWWAHTSIFQRRIPIISEIEIVKFSELVNLTNWLHLHKEKWLLILVEPHPQSSYQIWNLEVVQLSRLFIVEVGYTQMMHMFVVYFFSFI